ncbi:hypothetical protein BS47DRAFT_1351045 [Hydnum rufescens UP504]|uniref:Uncharacterized protein n=1 Tax=Hydnum rufescens UP504 TaxID=1448309 RepID=A0A9P6ALQ3_9AGAM|nr:hypothetical protein BS47DRAFT_1351045 [Hydnum rufescens UP504]
MQITPLGIVVYGHGQYIHDELCTMAKRFNVQFVPEQGSRECTLARFRELAATGTYHAILFVSAVNAAPFDAALLHDFLPSLKLVAGLGAGFDHVDVPYLTSHKVLYANTPVAVSDPTATATVLLVLQVVRAASQVEAVVRRNEWRLGLEASKDVRDVTVGLIGMGSIGKLAQRKLDALGFRTMYYNRRQLPAAEENGAQYVSFDELIETADVISLHTPLTNETRHLLSDAEFARMKDGVLIVNTARGAVIDEKALVRAMQSGKVARAGLDVFEREPLIEPYLLETDRTSLGPHWATHTTRTYRDVERELLANLVGWLKTGSPNTPVNEPPKSLW